ncbi:O-antigen ligase family protein [Paraburkholderia caballeronis]|uniref:O-antigen ligase family protein n=1 Tax=Paraburkholderia caballeronis TaxID=416943 RepID=UPI001066C435|nr:O-antigen ligase family protein [Paraburkholderia caballeronis]TDV12150.1 O-antigen ligase [Paraburkholderia caballeronis]TDV15225.1 O-antigen ligase [Paraburkholderia caballeronis]TDV24597.1 O-antigen ligase [Paraburkholderia caballeronis]TDV32779.1 O-antigen ligase [Paraburkholderia caballeronis]
MIHSPRLTWTVGILLFLAPAVNLMWRGGTGYCFFALLLMSLVIAFTHGRGKSWFEPLCSYRWYAIGMTAFLAAIVVQQLVDGYWKPRQFDALSRFTLALPIFVMLCRIPSRQLRSIGWGCAVGALAVGVWAVIDRPAGGWTDTTRLNNDYTNAIPFGDTALLLAFLSVFTFGWDRRRSRIALAIKLLALLAGGFVSYLSGTRGGWLAIPVFVILLGAQYRWFSHPKRIAVTAAILLACAAALLSTERMQHRLAAASSDLTLLQRGDEDTSVGLRLQLWQASLRLFSGHPVYGVGKGRLVDALGDLARHGVANPQIVNERAHSDFFSTIAETGTIGTICLLLFYFGNSVYFWRHRRAKDPDTRTAAYSGLAVSSSTIVFGLTIDVLVPIMVTALLALLSTAFLAMIEARRRELAAAANPRVDAR